MIDAKPYTTKLQAGLGLVEETKALVDLWAPGMSVGQLQRAALESGRFPAVTARRLRNIVGECFAPRYLVRGGDPVLRLKQLAPRLPNVELAQLMLLYTCRANPILADFVRQVYWPRYAGGYNEISNEIARRFVERAIDDGKTGKRWSETTIQRVSAYLTGCCADYGLLASGLKSNRRILSFRIAASVAAYLAYDLHLAGVPDNAMLAHEDWHLFGLSRGDVLEEVKRLSLKGWLILQSAADVIRISWTHPNMEVVCNVLVEG